MIDAILTATSLRSRASVERIGRDLFEDRVLDLWLEFSSDDVRAAYRHREAGRASHIHRELAKGTPEGNLYAFAAAIGQMLDAELHGANLSPAMPQMKREAFLGYSNQRAAIIVAGRSAEDADARLAVIVRTVLHARGISDAGVNERLAASPNPTDALREDR